MMDHKQFSIVLAVNINQFYLIVSRQDGGESGPG